MTIDAGCTHGKASGGGKEMRVNYITTTLYNWSKYSRVTRREIT